MFIVTSESEERRKVKERRAGAAQKGEVLRESWRCERGWLCSLLHGVGSRYNGIPGPRSLGEAISKQFSPGQLNLNRPRVYFTCGY